MPESRVSIVSFGLEGLGMHDDVDLLLAQAAGFGSVFAIAEQPAWIALGAGRFEDGESPLRVALAHPDEQYLKGTCAPALKQSLAASVKAVRFKPLSAEADWLRTVVEHNEVAAANLTGPMPAFAPTRQQEHALWMSRFLEGLPSAAAHTQVENRAGIVVLLRPLSAHKKTEPGLSALPELRRHLASMPSITHTAVRDESESKGSASHSSEQEEHIDLGIEIKRHTEASWKETSSEAKDQARHNAGTRASDRTRSDIENRSTTRQSKDDEHYEASESVERRTLKTAPQRSTHGRRGTSIDILNQGLRSGMWWTSIRAFGPDEATARRVAARYWSCVQGVAPAHPSERRDRPHVLCVTRPAHRPAGRGSNAGSVWDWKTLCADPLLTWKEAAAHKGRRRNQARQALYRRLKRHGIDVLVHIEGFLPEYLPSENEERERRRRKHLRVAFNTCPTLVVPRGREMLLTGRQFSTAFQLPAASVPGIEVVRGFDYCALAPRRSDTSGEAVRVGHYCRGGLAEASHSGAPEAAYIAREALTGHTLVTGATGAGKTTGVVSLLCDLRDSDALDTDTPNVHVAVLEGAKREYRHWRSALGIDAAGHFDLKKRQVRLNLFEHPSEVTPDAHISRLSSVFEATLDMPPPLPALMREGLARAYAAYHAEDDSLVKALHPVRFWLMKAVFEVVDERDYRGEVEGNIDAALRTRLRMLARGVCGRVLSGSQAWPEVAHRLTGQSMLLELESIADEGSRALIMALFVLYYRYALNGASRTLRNVLVLEEAHRIIGKRDGEHAAANHFFADLLSEVRAFGCGVIIADQSPARLIEDAMRNTNTKLLMRLVSGPDIRAAAAGAGLPSEAEADVPRLQTHQALLVRSGQRPALVRIDAEAVFAQAEEEASTPATETIAPAAREQFITEQHRAQFYDCFLRHWRREPTNPARLFRRLEEEMSLRADAVAALGDRARERLDLPPAEPWTAPEGSSAALRRLPFVWLALLAEEGDERSLSQTTAPS